MWGRHEQECDVLVVGAGPVGLMTALMLAERGIAVRIIDREKWVGEHNYALTLHPSTLKLLDDIGLAGELISQGTPVRRVTIRDREGTRGELRLDELPAEMAYLLVLRQAALEEALENRLRQKQVKVEWGHRLARITPEADRVRFEIEEFGVESGGYPIGGHVLGVERVLRGNARFVIAADGFHSIVRRQLQIEFEPTSAPMWYAVAEIDRDLVPYGEAAIVIDGDTADAVWPLPGGGCRWSLQLDPATLPQHGNAPYGSRLVGPALDREHVAALLGERASRWFDTSAAAVVGSMLVHFEPAIAQRFGSGRVQLAGDACHVTSPVGVQSMNAGLAEAHDLASRIAHLVSTGAGPEALESYDTVRQAAWRRVLAPPAVLPGADPWVSEHAARFPSYLPGTGSDLDALARQIGLELRG